jgi:capsular exopolysaccharide synthesis family protein
LSSTKENHIPKKDLIQDFFENFELKLFAYITKKSILFISILFFLSLLLPYLYLRYTTPIFETNATLIKKKENNNAILGSENVDLLKSKDEDKINRDIQIIKSDLLINNLIDSLNLKVQYFKKGRMFKKRFELNPGVIFTLENDFEIYNKSIFNTEVQFDFHDKNSFDLIYVANGKNVKIKNLKAHTTYKNQDLKIRLNIIDKNIEGDYIVIFNSNEQALNYVLSQVNVISSSPNINFSIKSTTPAKSEKLLSNLIAGFLRLDEIENAERLEHSIEYIKGFLDTINGQVKASENEKLDYVRANSAYNPSSQLESSITEIELYKKEMDGLEIELSSLERVKREIDANASYSKENIHLNEDKELGNLLFERSKLLVDYKPTHPTIAILDRQIQERIKTIQRNLKNEITASQNRIANYRQKKEMTISGLTGLPEKEMHLSKIQKELDIKEKYVFDLIEKQIQYLILKSSIGADYILIQPPKTKEEHIYPRNSLVYFTSLLLFFLISLGIIILRYVYLDKVVSVEEIKRNTHVPILGYIPFVPEAIDTDTINKNSPESRLVVLSNFKSRVSEVFKKMRASLKYTSAGEYQTICATSTIPGEGKTFVLINLAAVHALLEKKVLIIDLDLRKPRISKSFKLSNSIGMSNLLTDKTINIDDCIHRGVDLENLDIITSGPIPPNPSELITSQRFDDILIELKKKYDYIFIDTPPIGLVNESIEIVNKVDIPLYLVKLNHSHKNFADVLNETDKLKKNSNLFLIVNHFGEGPSSYVNSSYGYGYGYGYGKYKASEDGYYTDKNEQKKTSLFKRIINFIDWKL